MSAYLTRVQAGEELIVADRGKPVARIVPVRWQHTDDEESRLLDLQRRGVLRLEHQALSEQFLRRERPSDRDVGVRAALDHERVEGR